MFKQVILALQKPVDLESMHILITNPDSEPGDNRVAQRQAGEHRKPKEKAVRVRQAICRYRGFRGQAHTGVFMVKLWVSSDYPVAYGVRSRIGASATRWEQRFNNIDLTLVRIGGELKLQRWMLALIVVTTVIPVLQDWYTRFVSGG